MSQNKLTIKGIVDPQVVCARIMNKTKRRAKVVSPLEIPQVTASGLQTVELNVNMHCDACTQQLKATLLKMRGVQTVETEFSSGKVSVTGTMDANKLVEYVYKRSKKHARVIVPVLPEPAESAVESQEKEEEKLADAETKKEKRSGKQTDEKRNEQNKKEAEPEAGGDDAKPRAFSRSQACRDNEDSSPMPSFPNQFYQKLEAIGFSRFSGICKTFTSLTSLKSKNPQG